MQAEKQQEGENAAEEGEKKPNQRRGRDRTQTGKDIPRYKSRARVEGAEENDEEFEEPKFNSAYDEYRAGFWRRPKKLRIKVTIETEIPSMPKPLLEQPEEATYHKAQADVDEKIDALIKKSVSSNFYLIIVPNRKILVSVSTRKLVN